jgi:hypothetical protein
VIEYNDGYNASNLACYSLKMNKSGNPVAQAYGDSESAKEFGEDDQFFKASCLLLDDIGTVTAI